MKNVRLYLEIAVLLGSFVCLLLHLGSPLKVVYILLSPNPSSPLWWLAVLYFVYLVLLLSAFWRIHTGNISKTLGVLIFLIAIFTSTTLGWLLGMTDARPTLNASFFSFYFPLTGLASGMAALILFSMVYVHLSGQAVTEERSALYNEFARLMGIVAGMVAVLFLWRTISGGISSTAVEYRAFKHMIGSIPYNIEFWLGLGHSNCFDARSLDTNNHVGQSDRQRFITRWYVCRSARVCPERRGQALGPDGRRSS